MISTPVDDTGRISIWNMAPIVDAKDEDDENVPKMLCLLDSHSGLFKIVNLIFHLLT